MLIANHCGLRKVQRVTPARLQVKTFVSAGQLTHRPTIAPIIVAHLSSWAICLQSSELRHGSFPGWNAPEHGSSEKCNHNIYDEELSSERSYLNAAQTRGKKYGRA